MPAPLLVLFSQRAKRQIVAAGNQGSASILGEELTKIAGLLAINPLVGHLAENARRPGLRRFYLERIDYHLYYRVDAQRTQITVIAFRHARRRPVRL